MSPHWYYFLGQPVQRFSVELTNTCALSCPGCSRTTRLEHGFTEDLRTTKLLSLDFIKRVFPLELKHQKKEWMIDLTGNYGDAIYHPHLHDIIAYLKHIDVRVQLITNGSYRSKEWWQETARLLAPTDSLIFSIDGLADTNPIYRINSDWPSIMEAVRTTVPHTTVTWKWIVFKHNEHQIEAGKLLAQELGVHKFLVTKSGRLHKDDPLMPKTAHWLGLKSRNKTLVRELMRTRWQYVRRFLGPAARPLLRQALASQTTSPEELTIYPRCKTGKDIFISCDGHLFPCCYSRDTVRSSWFYQHREHFSLHQRGLVAILSDEKWSEMERAWQTPGSCPEVCVRSCGVAPEFQAVFGSDPKAYDQEGVDNLTYVLRDLP